MRPWLNEEQTGGGGADLMGVGVLFGVIIFYAYFMYAQTQPGRSFGQVPYILGITKATPIVETSKGNPDGSYNPITGFPLTPTPIVGVPTMTPPAEFGPRSDGTYGEVTPNATPFQLWR